MLAILNGGFMDNLLENITKFFLFDFVCYSSTFFSNHQTNKMHEKEKRRVTFYLMRIQLINRVN